MRAIGTFLLGFLLLSFLSPLLSQVGTTHYTPDIILLIIMYVGLTTTFGTGITLVLALGLVKDGFTPTPIGMWMEIGVIAFLVSHRLSRRLALRGPLALMFIAAFFSLGASMIELVLSATFDRQFGMAQSGPHTIIGAMVPQALATGPFAPVVFWLFDRLDAWTSRKTESIYMG